LCPGGTLTIQFQATAPAQTNTYTWTTQLRRDTTIFAIGGPQPTVTVDATPPAAPTLTQKPPANSNSSTATFAFADSDESVTFACRLDGGAFSACESPTTYTGLADGAHTFGVEAIDAAENSSAETTFSWTVDTVAPPQPTIDSAPPALTNAGSATFAFSDSEAGVGLQCRLDGAPFSSCASPKSYSSLADGAHTFAVRAVDAAGNSSSPASASWTIDTIAPTVTLSSKPAVRTNNPVPSFAFTASESGSAFSCALDGGGPSPCTSPQTYAAQADGPHTFTVRATDAAGNTGPPTQYGWTIDTVPPAAPTIDSAPPTPSNSSTASFAFSDTESGVGYRCRLDGGAFSSCNSPKMYSDIADGLHSFDVLAVDAAGNASSATSRSWTIDTVPPAAPTIDSKPANVTPETTARFVFSDGESGVVFNCRLDGGSFSSCTSPKDYPSLTDGGHVFSVAAVDAAGNASSAATWSWTVDTTKPVVTIASGPSDPTNATGATFTFSANKSPSTYACKLDAADFSSCTSPQPYTDLTDGPHTFQVRATDTSTGTTGLATVFTWTVDTVAPSPPAIAGGPPTPTRSTTASFVFADSEAGLGFLCRLDGGPFAPCTSPASYAALADGAHTFGVRSVDAAGNAGDPSSYTWVVDTIAPDTRIVSGPDKSATAASATFAFASSEGGASFRCSLDGGAPAPCGSPQTYGSLAAGPHSFTVAAVDAAGNADATPASYAWTVAAVGGRDTTPPGRVRRLAAAVGYGVLRLSWQLPADVDFDHVEILESTSARGPLQASVYKGSATSFTSRRFRNGTFVRYAVISYDHAGNHSSAAGIAVSPAALLRSPRDGSIVSRPPLLAWAAVPRAGYYNVQLYRSGKKVLSAWPTVPRLQLRRTWTYGRRQRLDRGTYRWYVWPGFGDRARGRYGQLLGYGTFVVR
jgi:hypothetical protein